MFIVIEVFSIFIVLSESINMTKTDNASYLGKKIEEAKRRWQGWREILFLKSLKSNLLQIYSLESLNSRLNVSVLQDQEQRKKLYAVFRWIFFKTKRTM